MPRLAPFTYASTIGTIPIIVMEETAMSNELRRKLHELQELSNNAPDPATRAIIEAIRLQTAVLNERLFAVELQLAEVLKRSGAQPLP
jgi:hypothetical protein